MVSFKALTVAAAISGAHAATSVCDKYTMALLKTNTADHQYTLLTLLVKTALIGNFTGPGTANDKLPGSMINVPGLLAKGMVNGTSVELAPYFTGELASTNVNGMPMGVNWLDLNTTEFANNVTYIGDSGSNAYTLISHLFSYFGAALGCSTYGMTGFPAYMGDNSMTNVHKYMDLNSAQVTWFVENVGMSAQSFGASSDDVAAVGKLLLDTFDMRCAPKAKVIPGQPAALQAICLASSCPLSPNATCSAYPSNLAMPTTASGYSAPAMTSAASMTSGSAMMSGSASASMTGSAMASSSSGAMASSSSGTSTGGAATAGISGVLALLAGVAAFAL